MRTLVLLILILLVPPAIAKPYEVGDTPFDQVGKTADGSPVRISDFKGKVVIISFWAAWCGPCRKELPVLSGIQKRATTDKLQVISINIDDDRRLYKKIAKALAGTEMKLIFDTSHKTGKKYGVEGIPHMLILDADGRVASVYIGYDESELPALVDEINEIARQQAES